jgi:hypothetical protein
MNIGEDSRNKFYPEVFRKFVTLIFPRHHYKDRAVNDLDKKPQFFTMT